VASFIGTSHEQTIMLKSTGIHVKVNTKELLLSKLFLPRPSSKDLDFMSFFLFIKLTNYHKVKSKIINHEHLQNQTLINHQLRPLPCPFKK